MSSSTLFSRLTIVNADGAGDGDIRVARGKIGDVAPGLTPRPGETVFDCGGLFAFPGLINSHDHLQFNLYSRIGTPPYRNAYEWGNDILTNFRHVVDPIEAVAVGKRYLWGAWKNLFSGVTFVVHHDPWSFHFGVGFPVWVLSRYSMAHSLGNEKHLSRVLARRMPDIPFIMHVAEGTDQRAFEEVRVLLDMNAIDGRMVAVHAVALSREDISTLEQAKASIVWCPTSNMFLLGETIPKEVFASSIPVALGTDSTLTGPLTLFDEMRAARSLRGCSAREIMEMVTEIPRRIFHIRDAGRIEKGNLADFFLLPRLREDPYESLLSATPADVRLLMRRGKIVFTDQSGFPLQSMTPHRLKIGSSVKEFREGGCVKLFRELRPFLAHYSFIGEVM